MRGERGERGDHEDEHDHDRDRDPERQGEDRVEGEPDGDIDEGEGDGEEDAEEDQVSMREADGQCPDEEFSDLQGFAEVAFLLASRTMSMIHQISESSSEPSTSAGVGGGGEQDPRQSRADAADHPSHSKDEESDNRPMPRSCDAVPGREMIVTGNGVKQGGEHDDAAPGNPRRHSNTKPHGNEREGKRQRMGAAELVEEEDEDEDEEVHRSGGESHLRCDAPIGNADNCASSTSTSSSSTTTSSHRPEPEDPPQPGFQKRLASFTWNTGSDQGGQTGGRGGRGRHMGEPSNIMRMKSVTDIGKEQWKAHSIELVGRLQKLPAWTCDSVLQAQYRYARDGTSKSRSMCMLLSLHLSFIEGGVEAGEGTKWPFRTGVGNDELCFFGWTGARFVDRGAFKRFEHRLRFGCASSVQGEGGGDHGEGGEILVPDTVRSVLRSAGLVPPLGGSWDQVATGQQSLEYDRGARKK